MCRGYHLAGPEGAVLSLLSGGCRRLEGCFGPGLCEILASHSIPTACHVQSGVEVGGVLVRGLRTRSERLLVWVVHTDMGLLLLRHALELSSWWVLRTHQGPTRDTPRPGTGWGFAGFLVGYEGSCL